jgi:hypothetical protein
MPANLSADGKAHDAGEFFADGWAGIENYRKQIIEEGFGLSPQASMRFMADITDIAEQKNHHGIMRTYGTKFGKYRHKPKHEWNAEVSAEKGKMETGLLIGRANRLSGYEELSGKDYAVDQTRIQIIQDNQLQYYLKNWNAIKFLHQRGQINPSQAKAAAMPQNAARIIAAASDLQDIEIVQKDANGEIVYKKDAAGKFTDQPLMVNQRDEALRVLRDLFIGFGNQQITVREALSNQKIVQELLDDDKIEDDAREAINKAMNNPNVPGEYKLFDAT